LSLTADASHGPSAPATGKAKRLKRFDAVERTAHWLMALMFITLVVTGAILYLPSLVELIGRRRLVERVHVDVGLAIPLPLLVSLAGKWGRGLRADIRRLNRWSSADREWLRRVVYDRRVGDLKMGKFNAGQKLNAAFTIGAFLVMLMTGAVMHWEYHFRLSWRTGATFIHESLAFLFLAVVLGHIFMALTHPGALRSIFTGKVTRKWAAHHSALWLEEIDGPGEVRAKR
jgi:formate dehydrogenase subunit gamma